MFCPNCKKYLTEETKFCPKCGTDLSPYWEQKKKSQSQTPTQAQSATGYNKTVDMNNIDQNDVEQNKGIAWLSYFGLFILIPMLARKTSKYCAHHVKQGWTLFAADIAYIIVTQILLAIIGAIFPGHLSYFLIYVPSTVYWIFSLIFSLGYIYFFVMAIMGIVYAASGKTKSLPLIGKIPWIANLLDKFYQKHIHD